MCGGKKKHSKVLVVRPPDMPGEVLYLHPATVRRNDQSAASVDEWTGRSTLRPGDIAEDIAPLTIQTVGNYAVQISWPDGLNQVRHPPQPYLRP